MRTASAGRGRPAEPPDDRRLYLDVPHRTPLAALAALAFEACAAVLLARLLGRDEPPGGGVVVRA
jgi:hypothetical protein